MGDELGVARRFGENLRRVRRQADLSQEELGFRASLHRTEVGAADGNYLTAVSGVLAKPPSRGYDSYPRIGVHLEP